jgi:NAD(P)-dependent dehydrogenase (short-subunit alcohol dehydrogenase family)
MKGGSMNIRLDDRVAMVTGAASGLGLACAELLVESGARVAMVDVSAETLERATRQVQEKGIAGSYQMDVTDTAAITATVRQIRQELGEIDILVASAGINIRQPAHQVTEAAWDKIMAVNLKGLFFSNQAVAVQSMIPRKRGSIINIASVMGMVGGPDRLVYCASKGGVIQVTRAEAIDWAPYNIRVNSLAPTYVRTGLTQELLKDPSAEKYVMDNIPLGRLATVEDIAAAACFLASDRADMITGAVLPVDGGWTAQ